MEISQWHGERQLQAMRPQSFANSVSKPFNLTFKRKFSLFCVDGMLTWPHVHICKEDTSFKYHIKKRSIFISLMTAQMQPYLKSQFNLNLLILLYKEQSATKKTVECIHFDSWDKD